MNDFLRKIYKENYMNTPPLDPKYLGTFENFDEVDTISKNNGDVIVVYRPEYKKFEILVWDFDEIWKKDNWIYVGATKSREEAESKAKEMI